MAERKTKMDIEKLSVRGDECVVDLDRLRACRGYTFLCMIERAVRINGLNKCLEGCDANPAMEIINGICARCRLTAYFKWAEDMRGYSDVGLLTFTDVIMLDALFESGIDDVREARAFLDTRHCTL